MSEVTKSPEQWFHQLATHYVEAQALFHLNQVGVFQLLEAEGPLGVRAIAERLGLTVHVLDALLDYVTNVDTLLIRDRDQRYALGEFGRNVLERFGRREAGKAIYNFFDVRVGAYGAVWSGLERLLHGGVYGRDVMRAGDVAADAVYKLVDRIEPALTQIKQAQPTSSIVDLGVSTGLLERLGARDDTLACYGVDRSAAALGKARKRAEAAGVSRVQLLEADVFSPDAFLDRIDPSRGPGLIFSVHFHEFIAGPEGRSKLAHTLARIGQHLPGWRVVAFEQPRLPDTARETLSETLWLYAQSNVLIHHLIGNGQILPESDWLGLLREGGCDSVSAFPIGYLGYLAFVGTFAK